MQKGDKALGAKNYSQAEGHYQTALRQAPNDYAGLVSMAKCQLIQKKYSEGARYARQAKSVYPQEAQGHHLSGFAALQPEGVRGRLPGFPGRRSACCPETPTPFSSWAMPRRA
ncbi:MAG: hypothetical protein MZV70_40920 [Desulfobacterales bacterium]|nr:hypothetical protein [Desulfobacterales bacterium]